jgi:CBS domain-containing protein
MAFKVKDAMNRTVISLPPDFPVEEACSLMLRHHISGMPVVDESERLVGIITENDILKLLLEPDNTAIEVADCMVRQVKTVGENDCLINVASLFIDMRVRRFPVLDGERLVGVIARRDLVRYFRDLRQQTMYKKDAKALGEAVSV